MRRSIPIAMLVTAALLWGAPAALAAPAPECGTEPAGATEPIEGTLVLKTEPSVISLDFGGSEDHKNMEFVFEVGEGCKLKSTAGITAAVHASEGADSFGDAEIELSDNELLVQLPVDPTRFGAGKYTAAVVVNGPAIVGTNTKVSFQRSETWVLPTILTVIFGLIGVAAAVITKLQVTDGKDLKVKRMRILIAVGAAVIPVAAVWVSTYGEVEIWQPTAMSVVTMFLATVAAASGPAGAAMLGESTEKK
jgi:hypothetical protein